MTRRQENIRSMWPTLLAILLEHEPTWVNRIPFKRQVDKLKEMHLAINDPAILQGRDDTGISQDKAALKLEAASDADEVGDIVQAYALDEHNMELYRRMLFGASELVRMADTTAKDKMNETYETATELADALAEYGLTADMLPNLRHAIDAYDAKMDDPRTAQVERTGGTHSIGQIITEGQKARAAILKQLGSFRAVSPAMVQQVAQAAIIVDHRGGQTQADAAPDAGDAAPQV